MSDQEYLPDLNVKQIMDILPHRYPMLMIDRLTQVTPNDGAVAIKGVTMNEPFFQGHFPGAPVMPGVFMIEAMAQAAACYTAYTDDELETSDQIVLFMGIDKAKFRRPVTPGDQLHIHVGIEQKRNPVWKFWGKAKVDGKVVCEAKFSAMLADKDAV